MRAVSVRTLIHNFEVQAYIHYLILSYLRRTNSIPRRNRERKKKSNFRREELEYLPNYSDYFML